MNDNYEVNFWKFKRVFTKQQLIIIGAAAVIAILAGSGIAYASFTGNAHSDFSNAVLPAIAYTANPPTGGSGGGSCGTVSSSGGTATCPSINFSGATSPTYTITYAITGGSSGETVTPSSSGTTGATVSCPATTLSGTGTGSGTCSITVTASSGTVLIQALF